MMKKNLAGLTIVFFLLCMTGTVQAAPWYQPADVASGDWYQIAFVTSTVTTAENPDLMTYMNFVNSAADNDSDLGEINFRPIISITISAARDIAFVFGEVYNTNGDLLATSFNDFWDGRLINPIKYNEFGTELVTVTWTGTLNDGTRCPHHYIGNEIWWYAHIGYTGFDGMGWIDVSYDDTDQEHSFYALSDRIRAVPIPSAIWLFGTGIAGILLVRRK